MSEKLKKTPKIGEAKFLLRIENELKKQAEAMAIETDRSLNGFIINAIKSALNANYPSHNRNGITIDTGGIR